MRVEIDTKDLVKLVKQFLPNKYPSDKDLLADIENMVTYSEDYDIFKHEVEITEF